MNSLADGTWTKRISKNGGAFAAMTVTITFMENGWYSVPLSTSHTDTNGVLSVTLTNASCKQINLQWRVSIAGEGANLTHIDALATSGNNATLRLKQLHLLNTTGPALSVSTTGGSSPAAQFTGSTEGILASGDASYGLYVLSTQLDGASFQGGSESESHGMSVYGGTNGDGLHVEGSGTGTAINDAAVDSILDRAVSEPASVFTWPASLRTIAQFLGALARNKITQTSTTQTVRNNADSGTIASSTQSDDGTTFTRGTFT